MILKYVVHWTQKYDQGVQEDDSIGLHCYDERYETIATPINPNWFTDIDLKKYKFWLEKLKT